MTAYGVHTGLQHTSVDELRSLCEATTFEGSHFRLADAKNEPRPVQPEMPLWIGGGGERRTLRIAARHADGGNVVGGGNALVERVQEYVAAGADQVNIAVRAPWDFGALEQAAEALGLA